MQLPSLVDILGLKLSLFLCLQCTGFAARNRRETSVCCFFWNSPIQITWGGHHLFYKTSTDVTCSKGSTGKDCDACVQGWAGTRCDACAFSYQPEGNCDTCLENGTWTTEFLTANNVPVTMTLRITFHEETCSTFTGTLLLGTYHIPQNPRIGNKEPTSDQ